jgi:fructose-1,6-bisphosphatase I
MAMIAQRQTLQDVLAEVAVGDATLKAASLIVKRIADASVELASLIAQGRLAGEAHSAVGSNEDGDVQKYLDIFANDLFVGALRHAPVAMIVSEEMKEPLSLDHDGAFVVAIDPVDGSSNIDCNMSIGTIFSILPRLVLAADPSAHFLQTGRNQIAAGFVIYGPQTMLVLAIAGKTHVFIFDRGSGAYLLAIEALRIPKGAKEYAINASNYRHWTPPIQAFIDDCVQGTDGPLGHNHNTRWTASLVAEVYRILGRGGVFLYPADRRAGYNSGRLRHVYEANPVALVVECAGGAATDCLHAILDLKPASVHLRVPFVFGSAELVEIIVRYHADPQFSAERAPLFGRRGLIRY